MYVVLFCCVEDNVKKPHDLANFLMIVCFITVNCIYHHPFIDTVGQVKAIKWVHI